MDTISIYVTWLLQDIAASANDQKNEISPEVSFEEGMEDVKKYCNAGNYKKSFGEYCGLDISQFPPTPQLNELEMRMIVDAFKQMALSWNQFIDLPPGLQIKKEYVYTIAFLEIKTTMLKYGLIHYAPEFYKTG